MYVDSCFVGGGVLTTTGNITFSDNDVTFSVTPTITGIVTLQIPTGGTVNGAA